jgi:N-acetylglucosaminyldiphosphoundecaprenol N-acetyl-beta-D-mannosaminyltransferase
MIQNDSVVTVFGINILNKTMEEAVREIDIIVKSHRKIMMYFINANNVLIALRDNEYFDILRRSKYVYGDGVGIALACKVLVRRLIDNVNGTDLFKRLCEESEKNGNSMFFLGSTEDVLKRMVENLNKIYPRLLISGFHHGYFDENENIEIISKINNKVPHIVLVGMGTPTQEKWIDKNISALQCNVVMGVGGLFDFYSGSRMRAPRWLQMIGLEWAFRLIQEPNRLWKRYLIGIPQFIYIVMKQKLFK